MDPVGTLLENVVLDPSTRRLNLDDASLTENTRASYPITHIKNAVLSVMTGGTVILTAYQVLACVFLGSTLQTQLLQGSSYPLPGLQQGYRR